MAEASYAGQPADLLAHPERTPEHESLFNQFKSRVQGQLVQGKFLHADHFLEKWLIARNWNVDKAVNMFIESEKFKKEMDVDNLIEWDPPSVLKEYYCGGIVGYAKDGSPVKFAATNLDMRGLLMSCRRHDLIRMRLRECELVVRELESQTKKLGKWVDKMVIIFEQSNGKEMLWGPARDLNVFFAKMLESNYPEMLGKMLIINAPLIFPLLWKLFRPLLAEETKRKIVVLGSDHKKALQQFIDDDQFPAAYGGSKVDEAGDPFCSGILGPQGRKVPEELYITEGLAGIEGAIEIEVAWGEKKTVELEVTLAGSFLKYEFSTREYDIGFGIDILLPAPPSQDGSAGPAQRRRVIPQARYNSHMAPEVGTLLCDDPGVYVLIFDNSFSWTRAKKLLYKAEVIPPLQDEESRAELRRMARLPGAHSVNSMTSL